MKLILVLMTFMSTFACAETITHWKPTSEDAKQLLGNLNLTDTKAIFDKGLTLDLVADTTYLKVVKVNGPRGILNQICGQSKIVAFVAKHSVLKGSTTILKAGFYSASPGSNPDFQPNLCVEYNFIAIEGNK